jgi:hypothetical protein
MIRVLAFIFLVVALGMAYLQVNDRPAWADFISPIEQPINSDGQLASLIGYLIQVDLQYTLPH